MALLDPARSDSPTATTLVAALVVVHEGSSLPEALEAVGRQVYEPQSVIVVGGGAPDPDSGQRWAPTVADALEALEESITHVWVLHDDSIPRPDALGALVREAERSGAELAGAKILQAGQPGRLESVGLATDVFEVPASGLDDSEVDQEQYDVLRDVAFVAGSSMLVDRAALMRVGGPDPLLEPITAALDLCQRIRLSGGRVVVVPSAEVLHDGTCAPESSPWRVEAGRLRAMLQAYSLVTLAWVVPLNFVLGLLEALISPLFGRWRLTGFVHAWAWNLRHLPSTIARRRLVPRAVGDGELFRFQVPGSARLTRFWQRTADRANRLATSEQARTFGSLVETGGETVRRPIVASLISGVSFALIATRQLWFDGVASVGYALAPPSSVGAALQSYAGGWNPSGLGSPEPLRPAIGLASLVQVALVGSSGLVLPAIVSACAVAGVVGVARLLGPFGVRAAARYLGGVFLIAGPAVRVLSGEGVWQGLVALAALPWALAVLLHRRHTRAAIAAGALLTAVGAAASPLFLVLPTAALGLWALVDSRLILRHLGRSVAAALLAIPALLPWFGAIDDVGFLFEAGPDFFWSPSQWVVAAVVLLTGSLIAAAPDALFRLSAWGALLAGFGALLARSGGFGWGTDPGTAGIVAAGLGMAILVGAGFEVGARTFEAVDSRRYLRVVSAVTAAALLIGTVTVALPGRLGFPSEGLTDTLSFTAEGGPSRALLIGAEQAMPGGGRELTEFLRYRVVSAPEPSMLEAWPTQPREGDDVLEVAVAAAISGTSFRLGQELAEFGIGWVVVLGDGDPPVALDAQLDLARLAVPAIRAYQVEGVAPRAVDSEGTAWLASSGDFVGPARELTVRIADNADRRWGERWAADGWANLVTTDEGVIEFGPIGALRRAALVSLIWLGGLVLGAAVVREGSP
jgi:GT2 family glycosyltransferase